jgi:hypothetical protein
MNSLQNNLLALGACQNGLAWQGGMGRIERGHDGTEKRHDEKTDGCSD